MMNPETGRLVKHCAEFYRAEDYSLSNADSYEDVTESASSGLAFLLDLHAHAAKRGCFLYGNRLKVSCSFDDFKTF